MKYTKELLEKAAKESTSIRGVMRIIAANSGSGGAFQHIKRKLKEFNIDTSHFLGLSSNKGKPSNNKKRSDVFLIHSTDLGYRLQGSRLRNGLLEIGREYKCCKCGNNGFWQGEKIVLEVHHLDNDWQNNTPENLVFACPNCHTQLDKKKEKKIRKHPTRKYECVDCKNPSSTKNGRCHKCSLEHKIKTGRTNWPPKEVLEKEVWETPATKLSKKYGVADRTIKSWCDAYNITVPPKGYWQKKAFGKI